MIPTKNLTMLNLPARFDQSVPVFQTRINAPSQSLRHRALRSLCFFIITSLFVITFTNDNSRAQEGEGRVSNTNTAGGANGQSTSSNISNAPSGTNQAIGQTRTVRSDQRQGASITMQEARAATPPNSQGNRVPGAAHITTGISAITLEQAIKFAIENNLSTLLAREGLSSARGRATQLLAELLPDVSASAFQQNRTANLRAQGISFGTSPFAPPAFVGPFNTFDARLNFAQTVFSLAAIRDYKSGQAGVRAAALQIPLARQQVASAVSIAYLNVLRDDRTIDAARADLELAQGLLKLAQDQLSAGVATGIDVVRAQTNVAQNRLRLLQAQTNSEQSRLTLERIVGLPQGESLRLLDPLRFTEESLPPVQTAIETAMANRFEIQIAEETVRQRELERGARVADQYPSLQAFGDYGDSGNRPYENSVPTRAYGMRLNVPIFNGGLTRGRIAVAASLKRQAELELSDTRGQVEADVRLSFTTLRTAVEQVRAADETFNLAERELQLARDRFQAGVADNIEVINAQTALQDARSGQINALAAYNAARANLAAALGRAETFRF
jgi:outer membrane protein TolC